MHCKMWTINRFRTCCLVRINATSAKTCLWKGKPGASKTISKKLRNFPIFFIKAQYLFFYTSESSYQYCIEENISHNFCIQVIFLYGKQKA